MTQKKQYTKKHFGQNFLVNPRIIERILSAIDPSQNDTILEIGAGEGAITYPLLERGVNVLAVEKDPELIDRLQVSGLARTGRLKLIPQDVLKLKTADLAGVNKVVGNIPYNISTPIVEWLITNRFCLSKVFLMTQLEFGERLTAKPFTKDYGALSCLAQYYADLEILFRIPNTSFFPVPKVTSCFLKISFRVPKLQALDEKLLFKVTQMAFSNRRKKISNALETFFKHETLLKALEDCQLDPQLRPDQMTVEDYVRLINRLAADKKI